MGNLHGYSTEGFSPHDTDFEFGGGQTYTGAPNLLEPFDFVIEVEGPSDASQLQSLLSGGAAYFVEKDSFRYADKVLRFTIKAKSKGEAQSQVQAAGRIVGGRRKFRQLDGGGRRYGFSEGEL